MIEGEEKRLRDENREERERETGRTWIREGEREAEGERRMRAVKEVGRKA